MTGRVHRLEPTTGERLERAARAGYDIPARLEAIRSSIRAESVSWGELAELQALAEYVDPGDTELLEWAGVPEQGEEGDA